MASSDTPFERNLGFLVSDIQRLLRAEFGRRAVPLGLPRAQWLLLAHLGRSGGASVAELADTLQQEKVTVSRQTSRMEKSGWLVRVEENGSGPVFRLSDKGEAAAARLFSLGGQMIEECFADMPPARRDQMLDDLAMIRERLERHLAGRGAEAATADRAMT